jgi:outer membrane protein assembly factor BamB
MNTIMNKARCLFAAAALSLAGIGFAQFDGPAPLAWRWVQPTRVAPYGSPVVQGDTVYVAVGQRIYALDKETGNKKWQFPQAEGIPGYFNSGVVYNDGMLIASADNRNVYAIDATTGEQRWQHIAPVGILGQPVVAGKFAVYQMSDNSLNAIDLANGEAAWKAPFRVFDGITGRISGYENTVLYFTNTFELRSLNVNTMRSEWRSGVKFTSVSPDAVPIVYGDTVYVGSGQYVSALNARSATGGRNALIGEDLAFGPAVSGAGVLAVTREGKAVVLDSSLRPTKVVVDLGSTPAAPPTAVGNLFLVPTSNGAINLIDPKKGEVVWSYLIRPLSGNETTTGPNNTTQTIIAVPASGPGVLAGSTLLVLARDGSLLAFDKKTGVDMIAPTVKMLWPPMGDMMNGQTLELVFKIDDDASGVNNKTLSIDIDGTPADFTYGRDGYALIQIGTYSKNKPLRNGRHNVTVKVTDWMGNATTSLHTFVVDNNLPPIRRNTGPTNPPPGQGTGGKGGGIGVGGGKGGVGGG